MSYRLRDVAKSAAIAYEQTSPHEGLRNMTSSDRVVMDVLCDHAHDDGTHCYPSIPTIMRESGTSKNTVRSALKFFEDLRWLQILEPGSGRRHTEYQITLPGYLLFEWDRKHPRRENAQAKRKRLDVRARRSEIETLTSVKQVETSVLMPVDEEVAY